ncbi:hypothetical protein Y027_5916 [Burkholderia pseudomallei TSV5]|nr:hypothetical protein Y027_5916 [Burkholderia pseudomallei TSV5]
MTLPQHFLTLVPRRVCYCLLLYSPNVIDGSGSNR